MDQLSLFDISFPIYAITNNYKRIYEELNVLKIDTPSGTYVLDNKNITGNTVGERRLKITGSDLYIPRKTYFTLGQMLHSKYTVFMDKDGIVFNYKKTGFVPLKYFKVQSITKASDGECVLQIPQVSFSYKVNCRKAYSIEYIGLLCTDFGFIPYEFTDEYKKPTRRKI